MRVCVWDCLGASLAVLVVVLGLGPGSVVRVCGLRFHPRAPVTCSPSALPSAARAKPCTSGGGDQGSWGGSDRPELRWQLFLKCLRTEVGTCSLAVPTC